ncbi:hypothetical protein RC77_03340 [Pectobacterium brasiliense]|uniref:DUF2971 domain-containing protein n=1 Tax=Pectobacterium brasiliense TaxID=180957 RepID=UPI00057E629C|nr:DUF2971 domain-containing protein [Pectobacterium brasiliense]KHS72133.1 hypothetical protein RC77_03340 [Pectobacterium brasiliense]
MTKIFKFSTLDIYKISSLASNEIWFSKLEDFNDPFEGGVEITLERNSAEELNEVLKNIDSFMEIKYNLGFPIDYADKYFEFLHKIGLADGEKIIYRKNYSNEEIKIITDFIYNAFKSELNQKEKYFACSFMESGNEVLTDHYMWSHYANGLRGYCLCFDKKKLTDSLTMIDENNSLYLGSANVNYRNIFPSSNAIEFFKNYSDIIHNPLLRQTLPIKLRLEFLQILSTKSNSWEKEKELRLFSGINGPLKYSSDAIKEIVIGGKMPINQQNIIIKIIKSINPKIVIKKAEMGKNSYDIKIEDYKQQ